MCGIKISPSRWVVVKQQREQWAGLFRSICSLRGVGSLLEEGSLETGAPRAWCVVLLVGLMDLAEELKHGSVGDGLSEGLMGRDLLKFVYV